MIRTLLATTALAGLLATSALAQEGTAPNASTVPASGTAAAASPSGGYVQRLESHQHLASRLTGSNVYENDTPDAASIGDIRNFVVSRDGKVAAVVISTSNLEENKTVAAPIDRIEWRPGANGEQRAVFKGDGTELQGAPVFTAQSTQEAAANGAAVPGSGAAMPAAGGTRDASAGNMTAAPTADTQAAASNSAAQTTPAPADSASMGSAGGYLAALGNDQKLSQDIIGSNVYSGPGDDAQTIGSVNDLVLSAAGQVSTAVVGVGGFLGIGEKNVGVPYAEMTMSSDGTAEPRIVMAATRDQLSSAPAFDAQERDRQSASSIGAVGGAMSPATPQGVDGATASAQNNESAAAMNADTATTASTSGSAGDRASMQPISGPELTADNLNGVEVYGPNDQGIGKVGDIALAADGRVDAVVVDVGGFLGIGSKPVAVAMENLQFMRDTNGTVNIYTQFTADQLKNAPEFDRETYAQNRSTMRLQPGNAPSPGADASGAAQPAQ